MGLLNNTITSSFIDGKITSEEMFEYLNEKLGSKYKVELLKKGSTLGRFVSGNTVDRVLVAKDAYHRTFVILNFIPKEQSQTKDETMIMYDRATLKWWLQALYNQTGFIGRFIIQVIYGDADEYYSDIETTITSKYTIEKRKYDYSLSSLWKK